MRIGVPLERAPGERRVAMVPEVASRVGASGVEISIEHGAGDQAEQSDDAYEARGVHIVASAEELYSTCDLICKVQPPSIDEVKLFHSGGVLVSLLQPSAQLPVVQGLAEAGVITFSLDLLPRISRAQSMDALSSQSTVSGYAAAIIAANRLPKFFPMFMTAAGTVPPAKVLVMGAGVAGLQAIATARRLGAVVRAYDVRSAAKEEVQSLGASFVELELETQEGQGGYASAQSEDFLARQRELIGNEVAASDVVITTAAIPGRQAPVLVTKEMVERMARGSVIVDLAAESGGNCELSKAGEEISVNDVLIWGAKNLPSSMAVHASFLYARNIAEFVKLAAPEGTLALDFADEIIAATCVTRDGAVQHLPTKELIEAGAVNGSDILELVTVFVLAVFVGIEVISKVPSILHTPLMSGTNAIHGVILVGAMTVLGTAHGTGEIALGFVAVVLATVNVIGGFVVTDRMLEMFKGRGAARPAEPDKNEPGPR